MKLAWLAAVVLSLLASVVNYGSNLAFSRILEPSGFSELSALLALSVIVTIPLGAGQTLVADAVARLRKASDVDGLRAFLRESLGHVFTLGAVVGIGSVLLTPLTTKLLGIEEPGPVLAFSLLLAVSFALPVILGGLQGFEAFTLFGGMLLAIALSRLLLGVGWAFLGGGPGGALGGQALGVTLVSFICLIAWRRWLGSAGTGAGRSGLRRTPSFSAIRATVAYAAVAVMANIDVVLSRVFLDPGEAGLYAALATLAKVAIFLPAAVSYIMVPSVTKYHSDNEATLGILRKASAAAAALITPFALIAALLPTTILELMFGTPYADAQAGVIPIMLAGTGLAILGVVCTYAVVIRDHRYGIVLVLGVVLQITLISLFHSSAIEIAWAQAGAVAATLVLSEILGHPIVSVWRRGS